jgi:hypothetical protein
MNWLVDDPTPAYFVLGVAALALAAGWWRSRERIYLIGLAIVGGLLALVVVLYFLIDCDAKRIHRKIDAMAAAVAARDVDRVFAQISDRFHLGSTDKAQFQDRVAAYIASGEIQEIRVWDYKPVEISRATGDALVQLKVKGRGAATRGEFYNCRSRFVLDPDGQWRLQTFELFLPGFEPHAGQGIALPF